MVFLIGGGGFVGSAFARALTRRGGDFRVLELNTYADYIGQSCDLLINANGNSVKMLSVREPLRDFDASVRSVRSSLVDFKASRYIHLSSCDIYPDCSSPDLTREDMPPDISRQSPYGFHKYLAEQCVRHAAQDWLIFRLGGFVGPGLRKNAIFDILHGGPLWLDPESELQFLSTDRCAEIALDLAASDLHGRIFNLCGNGVIRLQDVIDACGRTVTVNPGSPCVRYEASVEVISRYARLPSTQQTVFDFIQQNKAVSSI